MSLIRLILIGLLVILGYRFFKGWLGGQPQKEEVRGKPKNEPLDLRNEDVDEARFEDIQEKED